MDGSPEKDSSDVQPLKAGIVQAALHGAGRNDDEPGDLRDGKAGEVAQNDRFAKFGGKRLDGIPQEAGVHLAKDPEGGVFVRRVLLRPGGRKDGLVRLAARFGVVAVGHDPAHPAEERGLLDVVVDPFDDDGERPVDELLRVPFVGAKAAGEREQSRLVLAFKAFRPAFTVLSEFFNNVHFAAFRPFTKNIAERRKKVQPFRSRTRLPERAEWGILEGGKRVCPRGRSSAFSQRD